MTILKDMESLDGNTIRYAGPEERGTVGLTLTFSNLNAILPPSLHRSNADDPAPDLEAHLLFASICTPSSPAGLTFCIQQSLAHCRSQRAAKPHPDDPPSQAR